MHHPLRGSGVCGSRGGGRASSRRRTDRAAGSVVASTTSESGTRQQGICAASAALVITDLKSKGRRTALMPSMRILHAMVARSCEVDSRRLKAGPMPSSIVRPYSKPM